MAEFRDPATGVETALEGLTVEEQRDGWTILQSASGEQLSIRFSFHFFQDLLQLLGCMQDEIRQAADHNDLAGEDGIIQPDDQTLITVYYQYIENVVHQVVLGGRLLPGRPGIFYSGITRAESLTEINRQLFLQCQTSVPEEPGRPDVKANTWLSGQQLRFLQGYTSNTYGGGGTSTDKSFSFFPDQSFRYQYAGVVSMGAYGGSSTTNEGFGTWSVRRDENGLFLLLRWHLGSGVVYRLEQGPEGRVLLDGETYFLQSIP